ncbi:type II toxin-antitoxin system PemK/MazF family toxin [Pandoraea sp. XJJ-1]|uniref:type II toxin-antitoxin system PemK/MazF family toxin n=1 Tax=Pandoraea sp. XJJ-1 TaxID=3002643 RepID=UPI003FA3DAC4
MDAVKRGEVWAVSLDPAIGCEIRKTRPCVVILLVRLARRTTHDARRTTHDARRTTHDAIDIALARQKGLPQEPFLTQRNDPTRGATARYAADSSSVG